MDSSPLKTVTVLIVLLHEKHALEGHLRTEFCVKLAERDQMSPQNSPLAFAKMCPFPQKI